jgi:hypothetical protein
MQKFFAIALVVLIAVADPPDEERFRRNGWATPFLYRGEYTMPGASRASGYYADGRSRFGWKGSALPKVRIQFEKLN